MVPTYEAHMGLSIGRFVGVATDAHWRIVGFFIIVVVVVNVIVVVVVVVVIIIVQQRISSQINILFRLSISWLTLFLSHSLFSLSLLFLSLSLSHNLFLFSLSQTLFLFSFTLSLTHIRDPSQALGKVIFRDKLKVCCETALAIWLRSSAATVFGDTNLSWFFSRWKTFPWINLTFIFVEGKKDNCFDNFERKRKENDK